MIHCDTLCLCLNLKLHCLCLYEAKLEISDPNEATGCPHESLTQEHPHFNKTQTNEGKSHN